MQATFMTNRVKARAAIEHGEAYFPQLESSGPQLAQMFPSSPDEGGESVRLMYLLSIAAARKSLRLEQADFVPDELVITMLVAAAQRGVAIEIIVPGPLIDTKLVRRASRANWGRLLRSGVRIHEDQPTNFHCKIMIVDGRWSSVRSTNFDNRSFVLNDEANLNIYDSAFAEKLTQTFEADKKAAKDITFAAWQNRPFAERIWERFWSLFQAQM